MQYLEEEGCVPETHAAVRTMTTLKVQDLEVSYGALRAVQGNKNAAGTSGGAAASRKGRGPYTRRLLTSASASDQK